MSCVRASGRGEAARACKEGCFLTLVAVFGRWTPAAAAAAAAASPPAVFWAGSLSGDSCKGFKQKAHHLLLYARVLRLVLKTLEYSSKRRDALLKPSRIAKGFKDHPSFLLLYARVLTIHLTVCCYMQGF